MASLIIGLSMVGCVDSYIHDLKVCNALQPNHGQWADLAHNQRISTIVGVCDLVSNIIKGKIG